MPSGLVPNTNAFWLSLKVSRITSIESVSVSDGVAPRLRHDDLDGSVSKQMTPM